MSERPPEGQVPRKDHERELPPIAEVVQKTSRFSKEAVATMISLATSAFGFVAALAWNTAITTAFTRAYGDLTKAKVSALFIYAVFVTLIGVIVIVLLGRLATRLRTEPLEFKYPGTS
ncbi:MAG TPA: DUF5654 family protein [Actinomycetota bacterium]|jgi:uncharacterized membrane protein YjjP (DUF1212 family)